MQLTFRDILRVFDISEKILNDWIDRKNMPCVFANEQYRFNYIHLLEWTLQNHIPLTPELLNLQGSDMPGFILTNAFKRGRVCYDLPGNDREEVLRAVVESGDMLTPQDRTHLYEILLARELIGSTAIGNGIAVPHVRNPIVLTVQEPVVNINLLKSPINFRAPDHKPVDILFLVLSPSVKMHLALLARLAFCLQNTTLSGLIRQRTSKEEILAGFMLAESKLRVTGGNKKDGLT